MSGTFVLMDSFYQQRTRDISQACDQGIYAFGKSTNTPCPSFNLKVI